MPITHIHSYLVQPGKNLDVTELSAVSGTEIKLEGKIFEMMSEIYGRSGGAGDLSVRFASDSKQNDARDLIVDYAVSPTESSGRLIAERLQSFTDGTPGLGLLFLIRGTEEEGASTRTIVSRFPADVGILAEVQKSGLEIEYLEQVFMKSSKRYKAAIYEDADPSTGFWKGQVVDRQINSNDVRATADYWLLDFLASELFTTSISGSRRFGRIINQAIKQTSDPNDRDQLIMAAKMAGNFEGKKVSPATVAKRLGLSKPVTKQIKAASGSDDVFREAFQLSRVSMTSELSFQTVELTSGAIMTGPTESFDELWTTRVLDEYSGLKLYQTQGIESNRKLQKRKP